MLATKDYGNDIQEDLNAIVGYDETFNNAIVRHTLDLKNRVILLNPNPLNVIFRDIKKFDQQNPIIDIIATQVKASKLTEDQLTKKSLAQDEITNIENRLNEIKRKNVKDKDDDDNSISGARGGGGDDGTPRTPRPPTDEVKYLSRRLDVLRGNRPRTSYIPRLDIKPDDDNNMQDVLNNRFNRLRYGPTGQSKKKIAKRLVGREQEIACILKGIVKTRKSDANRGDYFPPPPVGLIIIL